MKSQIEATKQRIRDKHAKKLTLRQIKICLTMIVKNESKIITRALDSAKKLVDYVFIVDTGSEDDTIEVIQKWLKDNEVEGQVIQEPFKNFGYNRTHSFEKAKEAYPDANYQLLMDADMILEGGDTFKKYILADDKYLIEQYNKAITYWNIRILSNKHNWKCIGVTHEYWGMTGNEAQETESKIPVVKITNLKFDDRADGGCKADKFTRDKRLLLAALEDPNEPAHLKTRYKFYLAQTLRDMNDFEGSIHWYQERINDKGWIEEVFISYLYMGKNYERWGFTFKNVAKLNEALITPISDEMLSRGNLELRDGKLYSTQVKIFHEGDDEEEKLLTEEEMKERKIEIKDGKLYSTEGGKALSDEEMEKEKVEIKDGKAYSTEAEKPVTKEEMKKRRIKLKDGKVYADLSEDELKYMKDNNPNNLSIDELSKEATKKFEAAAAAYVKGYNHHKKRAESLYHLVAMYRTLGQHQMALDFALVGREIPYPERDTLFVDYRVYDYLFDFEISIVAFYVPDMKDIGAEATAMLLDRHDIPEQLRELIKNNSRHYL